jgi:hypothetical protein
MLLSRFHPSLSRRKGFALGTSRSLQTGQCRINESGGGINRKAPHEESELGLLAFPFGDDSRGKLPLSTP